MSSTNRGGVREVSDYYVTPQWAIQDFLTAFTPHCRLPLEDGVYILDPCAGGDKKRGMAYPDAISAHPVWRNSIIETIDIRQDSRATNRYDYLACFCKNYYDVIITNPPFALAMPIISKALDDVCQCGYVIMLLRLNFLGGTTKKKEFFERVGLPVAIYVHRQRMSFTPNGKKDSIEYAHFVWRSGFRPEFTKLHII